MTLSRAERTTTINYDDSSDTAEIVTYSIPLINSLRKNLAATEVGRYPEGGAAFRIPKKLINVRQPRKARRPMTEEEKQAASDRLVNARAAKSQSGEK